MEDGDGLFPKNNPGLSVRPTKITYSNLDFSNFVCRAAIVDGKQIGEYHIRPKNRANFHILMEKLRNIDTSEVGVLRSDDVIKLEYPIYLKVNGILAKEAIYDTLVEINDFFEGNGQTA